MPLSICVIFYVGNTDYKNMVIRYIMPDGYTVRHIKYDMSQNSDKKITCPGIKQWLLLLPASLCIL